MKAEFKAKVRGIALAQDPAKVKVTIDSPEFKQLSWVEIEVPRDEEPRLGEELTVTIERGTK